MHIVGNQPHRAIERGRFHFYASPYLWYYAENQPLSDFLGGWFPYLGNLCLISSKEAGELLPERKGCVMIQEKYGTYELSSYDPIRLVLPNFDVSDEAITAEMERIAARYATNRDIEPHPINANDIVRIDIRTTEEGGIFPGLTHEDVDVQLGVGMLSEELEHALLGHEVGDVVEADYMYTDMTQVASDRETPADGGCGAGESGEPEEIELHSVVKVKALRTFVVPQIEDAWVAERIGGARTVDEFRAMTAKRLKREHQREYVNSVEYKVIEELGHRLVQAPPQDAIERIEQQMLREFDRFLEQYELDRPSYMAIQGLTDLQFADQVAKDAHDRIAQDIALASWATHNKVELTDEDIDFMFGEPTPERTYEARVEAEQSGQIDTFKDLALRAKVAEMLTRNAIYIDADGNVDENFKQAVNLRYEKLQKVRDHATSDPMMAPPMVPVRPGDTDAFPC